MFRENRQPHVLVEQHVYGRHYRVNMAKEQVIDVVERIPAYVEGDGESTIRLLIEHKNLGREKSKLPPIQIDHDGQRTLRKSGFELEQVPAAGQVIQLQTKINLSIGGEERMVPVEDVPAAKQSLFAAVAKTSRLVYAGLDVISPDITSGENQDCVINEVNAAAAPNMVHVSTDPEHMLLMPTRLFEILFDTRG